MTKQQRRDDFAKAALTGMLAKALDETAVRRAYNIAEQMLAESDKRAKTDKIQP